MIWIHSDNFTWQIYAFFGFLHVSHVTNILYIDDFPFKQESVYFCYSLFLLLQLFYFFDISVTIKWIDRLSNFSFILLRKIKCSGRKVNVLNENNYQSAFNIWNKKNKIRVYCFLWKKFDKSQFLLTQQAVILYGVLGLV